MTGPLTSVCPTQSYGQSPLFAQDRARRCQSESQPCTQTPSLTFLMCQMAVWLEGGKGHRLPVSTPITVRGGHFKHYCSSFCCGCCCWWWCYCWSCCCCCFLCYCNCCSLNDNFNITSVAVLCYCCCCYKFLLLLLCCYCSLSITSL